MKIQVKTYYLSTINSSLYVLKIGSTLHTQKQRKIIISRQFLNSLIQGLRLPGLSWLGGLYNNKCSTMALYSFCCVMSEIQQKLVFSILQHLTEVSAKAPEGVDVESLEVAIQCLGQAFSMDVADEEHKKQYAIGSPLEHIFKYGLALDASEDSPISGLIKKALDTAEVMFVSFPLLLSYTPCRKILLNQEKNVSSNTRENRRTKYLFVFSCLL